MLTTIRKSILTLTFSFCLLSSFTLAQNSLDVGGYLGIASYDGDFTPGSLGSEFSFKNLSYRLKADFQFSPRISLGLSYKNTHLESEDKQSTSFSSRPDSEEPRRISHNFFQTDVRQFIIGAEVNVLRFDILYTDGFVWTPYVGLEANYQWYTPRDKKGQPLSGINPQNYTGTPNGKIYGNDWAIDYVLGFKFKITDHWYTDLNFTYVQSFKDDLDGVTNLNNEVFATTSLGVKYLIPFSNPYSGSGVPSPTY